jgi:DNA-binding CsgD family transcriptional regulator
MSGDTVVTEAGAMTETITGRDWAAVRAVIEDGHRDEPTAIMPWSVLEGLAALIPCDTITVPEGDYVRGRVLGIQRAGDGQRHLWTGSDEVHGQERDMWRLIRDFRPCSYGEHTGDFVRVVRFSDFYSVRQLRDHPLITDYWAPAGRRHNLGMSLLTGGASHRRRICLWRSAGPDFSDRDRLVLELLRPHLWEIYTEGKRRRRAVPHLSRREWEVLRLADQGHGNTEIAAMLCISVATVRKHFENIFDRTGARTRAAACALMLRPDL